MKHNLEKDLKRWLKRKVSISLATIVIFAITGSVGFAETLATDLNEGTFFNNILNFKDARASIVAEYFNKTNKQVNINTEDVAKLRVDLSDFARKSGDNEFTGKNTFTGKKEKDFTITVKDKDEYRVLKAGMPSHLESSYETIEWKDPKTNTGRESTITHRINNTGSYTIVEGKKKIHFTVKEHGD